MTSRVQRVLVVVPICQEAQRLSSCLTHLERSIRGLREQRGIPVEVVLVLDRCTDGSVALAHDYAANHPMVEVVSCRAGTAGRARCIGVETALRRRLDIPLEQIWIGNTDADSTVPPRWLLRQVELADQGADLVTGTVEPVEMPSAAQLRSWQQAHRLEEGHPYVHGANLGVRGSVYRSVGGFRDVPEHEDALLVEAARCQGYSLVATDTTRVRTSARADGRTPGGFAGYVRGLDCSPALTTPSGPASGEN